MHIHTVPQSTGLSTLLPWLKTFSLSFFASYFGSLCESFKGTLLSKWISWTINAQQFVIKVQTFGNAGPVHVLGLHAVQHNMLCKFTKKLFRKPAIFYCDFIWSQTMMTFDLFLQHPCFPGWDCVRAAFSPVALYAVLPDMTRHSVLITPFLHFFMSRVCFVRCIWLCLPYSTVACKVRLLHRGPCQH